MFSSLYLFLALNCLDDPVNDASLVDRIRRSLPEASKKNELAYEKSFGRILIIERSRPVPAAAGLTLKDSLSTNKNTIGQENGMKREFRRVIDWSIMDDLKKYDYLLYDQPITGSHGTGPHQSTGSKLKALSSRCIGRTSCFSLSQNDAGEPIVRELGDRKSLENKYVLLFEQNIGTYIKTHFQILTEPLHTLFAEERIKILEAVESTVAHEPSLLVFNFTFQPKDQRIVNTRDPSLTVSSGWMKVNPEQHLRIEELSLSCPKYPDVYHLSNEFENAGDTDFPVLKKVRISQYTKTTEIIFETLNFGSTPPSDFTLSRYGIPEVAFTDDAARRSGNSSGYYLSTVGILGLVLAFVLRLIAQCRKVKQ